MTNSKTTRFTLDFFEKAIIGTKTSFNKASKGCGAEYEELTAKMAKYPDFTLTIKEPKTKSTKAKTTYEGLCFEFMEEYISYHTNHADLMARYKKAKAMAKDLNTKVYPLVKKWFLEEFTEFKMDEAKEYISHCRLEKINAISSNVDTAEDNESDYNSDKNDAEFDDAA